MAQQLPQQPRREMISWAEVDRLIDHLIPQFKREFTAMVMITRGGVIPGGMLAEAMDITHILTAAVDFPAQFASQRAKLMVWPEFIQFPSEDKPIVASVYGSFSNSETVSTSSSSIAFSIKSTLTCFGKP